MPLVDLTTPVPNIPMRLMRGDERERFARQRTGAGSGTAAHKLRPMSIRADQKALIFLGAIGVLGAGVRALRASTSSDRSTQPALEHQMQVAESSAKAIHTRRGRGRSAAPKSALDPTRRTPVTTGPLDRRGYIAGKLDLDVATAAQINSLPRVSRTIAKRIVLDRMVRGPFLNRDGLRRVAGIGPAFLARIDSLITFSGTVVQPSATDTVVVRRAAVRVRKR